MVADALAGAVEVFVSLIPSRAFAASDASKG
jgi:hypothetical protein